MAEETTKGGTNWFNQAYMVAGGGTDDLQASKGMAKIGDAIAKPVAQELQQRRAKFKAFAEWELTRKPGLTDKDYDKKIDDLNKMKADYIWADNASRMKIMRHMVDMKAEQDALDAEKKALAESIEDEENGVGGNKDFMEDGKMEGLLEAYQNGPDEDGIYRDSAGNEYTEDEIKELTSDKNKKDGASEDIIRDLALQFRNISGDSYNSSMHAEDQGGDGGFNWEETYAKIDNVVSNGNFRSLVNDNMIQGRSATFRNDLEASLVNQTYTGFGIEADSYTDPNLDGDNDYTTISPEDAKVIADEFLKMDKDGNPENPDAKKWVTNYYTAHMEKQFNSGQSGIYGDLQFVEEEFDTNRYMDLMSDSYNQTKSVQDLEWWQNKIAGSYGQLSKEHQIEADKVLKSLDESIIKKQNQNKYNTNAQ